MKIAYGNNRFAKRWSNKEITFDALCERLKTTTRTTESVIEYQKMSKSQRDDVKDVGGYVLGHLRGGVRKRNMVECRSAITLDADNGDAAFLAKALAYQSRGIVYTTHSHTPDAPRFRMILPLQRDISADEYICVARLVANDLSMDAFDDSTYEPSRLMYWPSTPQDGEYLFRILDGQAIDPDEYLTRLSDWHDCSLWPTSSRQSAIIERNVKKQEDPLTKKGVVGAFCRAYRIEDTITTFLSDVYEPTVTGNRYTYKPGSTSGGLAVYEDGRWAYSHHGTDPAGGMLLNAFDLVRVHQFGHLDEKQSFNAMCEYAVRDNKVNAMLADEKRAEAMRDFTDDEGWAKHLERGKHGKLVNNLRNITLILNNDPTLKGIVFNQLADGMEIKGDVPWNHPARFWRDADDAQLISYVDSHYGTFSSTNYNVAVAKVTDDRSYHPIREYLQSLPPWDGVTRVDTLLVDYLGATDNDYTRAVTRKTLCAAVARVYNPGVKFDYILVLNGAQGVGKSTLIAKLGGEWYSDSLSITDMNDKTAAEKLQGYWILEIGELAGMRTRKSILQKGVRYGKEREWGVRTN